MNVTMTAMDLMRAADRLSGVRPGMTHTEIRQAFDSMTRETLEAAYLCEEFKKTTDGARRAEIRDRLIVLVQGNPEVSRPINQALPLFEAMTRQAKRAGRPRKHASDAIRRRAASRAYRERKNAGGGPHRMNAPPTAAELVADPAKGADVDAATLPTSE